MSDIETPQTSEAYNTDLVPIEGLIGEVASFIGGDKEQTRVREQAIKALDRAARRMNLSGIFLFNLVSHIYTTASSPAFSNGDSTLTLPDDFAWPADPITILDGNGDLIRYAEWVPWHIFKGISNDTTTESIPSFLSLQNEYNGTVSVYPSINTNDVGTIEMGYFRRIQKPSEAAGGSTLYLPDEALECILTGAEYFLIRHRHKDDPIKVRDFKDEFYDCITQARAAAHRRQQAEHITAKPDEAGLMYSHPYTYAGSRPIYIRVP